MPWNILGTLVSTRQISLVSMTNQMLTNDDKRTNKKSDTGKLAHERRSWKNWIGTCHPPCIKIEVDGEGLLVPFLQGTRPPGNGPSRKFRNLWIETKHGSAEHQSPSKQLKYCSGKRTSHAKRNYWNQLAQQISIGFFRIPPCSYEVLCIFRRTKPCKATILIF